jgi:hypothetical protein
MAEIAAGTGKGGGSQYGADGAAELNMRLHEFKAG